MAEVRAPAFFFPAGRPGALLLHGFTASPTEMRPLGEHLHRAGFSVLGARLAGHGTLPEELARTRWQDWLQSAREALLTLHRECGPALVCGLSMGALLAALLAVEYPHQVRAVSLIAPAFAVRTRLLWLSRLLAPVGGSLPKSRESRVYLARHELFSYPSMPIRSLAQLHGLMGRARLALPRLRQPALIAMGQRDPTVPADSALDLFARLGSAHKNLVFLPRSAHILTVEPESPLLAASIERFGRAHT